MRCSGMRSQATWAPRTGPMTRCRRASRARTRARRLFRGGGSLEAWVYRIVLRTAREQGRKPRPVALAEDLRAPDQPSHLAVLDAVRRLSPRRRLVVFLRFFADLSYAEIA